MKDCRLAIAGFSILCRSPFQPTFWTVPPQINHRSVLRVNRTFSTVTGLFGFGVLDLGKGSTGWTNDGSALDIQGGTPLTSLWIPSWMGPRRSGKDTLPSEAANLFGPETAKSAKNHAGKDVPPKGLATQNKQELHRLFKGKRIPTKPAIPLTPFW
jgi:hypothetical protein